MRKPVSLSPAGLSLKGEPQVAASSPSTVVDSTPVAVPRPQRASTPAPALVREIETAVQVAEAAATPPAASVAADFSQTIADYWMQQANSFWNHGVALAQSRSVSEMVEAQGHFVRQQVEMARAQSTTWASLINQGMGLSAMEKLPSFTLWAPWQTTLCKPGG